MRNRLFAYAKTKTQISFAVTAKLIRAFVFATRKVQCLYFLNLKFQASSHLLWLYSLVCIGPGRNPEDRFSQNEAHMKRVHVSVLLRTGRLSQHASMNTSYDVTMETITGWLSL